MRGETRWFYDPAWRAWMMVEPANDGTISEPIHRLDADDARRLLSAMQEGGWVKPTLDDLVRQDDVKIIHRLIDTLQGRREGADG